MLGNEAIQQLSKRSATLVPGSSSSSGGAACSDEQPKENLKMATEKMRRARDGCRNTLAAAAKTMSSPGFHFDLSCISLSTAPLRAWHGDMAKRIKHGCAARAFYAREARFGKDSGLRAVLQEMLNPFGNRVAIERMGFTTSILGKHLEEMDADHVSVIVEQRLAQRLWRLQLKVVRSTLGHFLYLQNYPCKLAQLLIPGVNRTEVMAELHLVSTMRASANEAGVDNTGTLVLKYLPGSVL